MNNSEENSSQKLIYGAAVPAVLIPMQFGHRQVVDLMGKGLIRADLQRLLDLRQDGPEMGDCDP